MLGLFAALAILLVGAVVVQPRLQPHVFHGSVLQAGNPVDNFTLTAQTGQPVSLSDFRGKYVVLYFGYTSCPDICPLTLAQLSQAMRLLGKKAQDVQVIMVTVDPERDTPQRLASYLTAFSPAPTTGAPFLGLTGTVDQIRQIATPLGIVFEKHNVEGQAGYLMDHTASVLMLDPQGRLRLIWPVQTSGEFMADDLKYMMG